MSFVNPDTDKSRQVPICSDSTSVISAMRLQVNIAWYPWLIEIEMENPYDISLHYNMCVIWFDWNNLFILFFTKYVIDYKTI